MKGTPDANLFAVLSADIDAAWPGLPQCRRPDRPVDTLESFMKDFSRRRDLVATN